MQGEETISFRGAVAGQKIHQTSLADLRAVSARSLARMYLPAEQIFVFRLRRTARGIIAEGRSPRYTAITLIGLANETEPYQRSVLGDHGTHAVCDRLNRDVGQATNLGDVALSAWAARAVGYPDRTNFWKRLVELKPGERAYPVVELSWALDAACIDPNSDKTGLAERLAQRLLESFSRRSRVFPHVVGTTGTRSHVSCFADMVYPIHALSRYAKLSGDTKALDAATLCAEKICEAQGPAGQWWWHYDSRTGDVVEGYPVYAIHQDAMAPMALFALRDAGGPDFSAAIRKGLDWLLYSPEIRGSLIDKEADLIWRKVARREPRKLTRYLQAGSSMIHPSLRLPGLDFLFPPVSVDYEDRPYHLGWLLYAWPAQRAKEWDQQGP